MNDPEKEQFILDAIEKIKELRHKIAIARKNKQPIEHIMRDVQDEIQSIKDQANLIFESTTSSDLSPDELESYTQNPSNFSKEDWALLENLKSETEKCKREIIKSNDPESIEDIIGKNKGSGLRKKPKKNWG